MKSRWFNYRPLCIVFIFLLLGSVFVFYLSDYKLFTIIITIIIFVFLMALTILKRRIKYVLIPLISFILGASLYYGVVTSFQEEIETPSAIQARIYNVNLPEDGRIRVYADSCEFDGKEIKENLIIYIYDNSNLFENIEIGSIITFSPSNFYQTDLFYYGTPNASYYLKGLKYSATVSASNVTFLKTDKTFAEKLKQYVKDNLRGSLTNENVEIAYSSLFGDVKVLKCNLLELPFPLMTKSLDNKIVKLVDKVVSGDFSAIQRIQNIIYNVYGLTPSQRRYIHSSNMRNKLL